jgi:hypothetical protein
MQLHEHPTEHLRKRDGRRNQERKEVQQGRRRQHYPRQLQPSVPSQPSYVSAQPAGRGFVLHELFSAKNRFVQSL